MTSENGGPSIQEAADKERREAVTAQCANATFVLASKIVEIQRLQKELHEAIEATHRNGCEPEEVHRAMISIMGDDEALLSALDSIIRCELEMANREIAERLAAQLGVDPSKIGIITI